MKKKGYLSPPPCAHTGNNQITNAGKRPDIIPMLLKGAKAAVPLTIGFIITENHPLTIYGDYFTAHGLGDELEKHGYRIVYLPEPPIYEWLREYHRGEVPHTEIPKIYNSSKIVLEDCTPMCRPWGCINTRTFEAMAGGACVISNEVPGLKELFGDNIITYGTREDLKKKIIWLLQDEKKRNEIGEKAREAILKHHTYKHRAKQFREVLSGFLTL